MVKSGNRKGNSIYNDKVVKGYIDEKNSIHAQVMNRRHNKMLDLK